MSAWFVIWTHIYAILLRVIKYPVCNSVNWTLKYPRLFVLTRYKVLFVVLMEDYEGQCNFLVTEYEQFMKLFQSILKGKTTLQKLFSTMVKNRVLFPLTMWAF
jgi:hypothetical protein